MDLEFKTLTFKIGGLSETNRVENHKSIPIYNYYWWLLITDTDADDKRVVTG